MNESVKLPGSPPKNVPTVTFASVSSTRINDALPALTTRDAFKPWNGVESSIAFAKKSGTLGLSKANNLCCRLPPLARSTLPHRRSTTPSVPSRSDTSVNFEPPYSGACQVTSSFVASGRETASDAPDRSKSNSPAAATTTTTVM